MSNFCISSSVLRHLSVFVLSFSVRISGYSCAIPFVSPRQPPGSLTADWTPHNAKTLKVLFGTSRKYTVEKCPMKKRGKKRVEREEVEEDWVRGRREESG